MKPAVREGAGESSSRGPELFCHPISKPPHSPGNSCSRAGTFPYNAGSGRSAPACSSSSPDVLAVTDTLGNSSHTYNAVSSASRSPFPLTAERDGGSGAMHPGGSGSPLDEISKLRKWMPGARAGPARQSRNRYVAEER